MEETQLHILTIGPPATTIIEPVPDPQAERSSSKLMAPLAEKESGGTGISTMDNASSSTSSESDVDEYEECDCITEVAPAEIPYISIYETEKDLKKHGYFSQPPAASIVNVERDTQTMHLIDRYIYTIEVKHGKHEWLIHRRYSDFRTLNSKLLLFRAGENLSAPMHRLAERRHERRLKAQTLRYGHDGGRTEASEHLTKTEPKSEKPNTIRVEKTIRLQAQAPSQPSEDAHAHPHRQKPCKLPHFPLLPDTAVSAEKLDQRKEELGRYLSAVLHVPAYRNHNETLEFLGVSRLSFVGDLGLKGDEGYIKKGPGGIFAEGYIYGCKRFFVTRVAPWRKRWFVVKDSYVVYLRPKHQEISEVVLFEKGFKIDPGIEKMSCGNRKKAIVIQNMHRTLRIKCHHEWEAEEWRRSLAGAVQSVGSIWVKPNRFGSSYPIREDGYARWFVDGRSFMEEAAHMIYLAKEDIFITDWWLSPEVLLKRPGASSNSSWRLDLLLKKKAEEGVRVFILLYKEVTIALSINSLYTKAKLQALHPNIKVQRHRGAMHWAHHEKLIVIDQSVAFVGGIDLCYGRWDDHQHRLADTAGAIIEQSISLQEDAQLAGKLLDGLFLYGKRKEEAKDEKLESGRRDSRAHERRFTLKKRESRADQPLNIVSENPREPSPEFDGSKGRRKSKGLSYLAEWRAKAKQKRKEKEEALKEAESSEDEDAIALPKEEPVELTGSEKWWLGKDYVNFIFKDFIALDSPFADFIDRTRTPRMPWHDIASAVYGSAARDVARHFIERWNACKVEKCHNDPRYPFLLPKSYDNLEIRYKSVKKKVMGCRVQIIRSASLISTGRNDVEDSIYQAYIHAIEQAQHYIYIENQFFVSQVGSNKIVSNGIAQALYERIIRAHKNNESFRVYVVMPLLPGFEVGTALFTVLHWTYLSISKGTNSLLVNLKKEVEDPSRYITFCSLRKYDSMGEKLVTELIYIHSKLLIVDDRVVIIGSANINDRSQMGDRDSEVAIYTEDTQFDQSTINGKPYQSGKFAGSLRKQLFREHLGLLEPCPPVSDEHATGSSRRDKIDVTDPASESFWNLWNEIAKNNTQIFEEIFDCLPNDNIKSQKQLEEYKPGNAECVMDKRKAQERIKGIQGFLVLFPLEFLINSDLTPPLTTKEGWAPSSIFI